MKSGLVISRCISREELEQVVDLCDRAFPGTPREYFERHTLRDATLKPEDTIVGRVDGSIVSSIQIFPRTCWVEGHQFHFGGIGNVATDPLMRGSGFAGSLMAEAIELMSSKGFAFSLLTTSSITAYYEKFGYRVIPREALSFESAPDVRPACLIRPVSIPEDLPAVRRLYDRSNCMSVGPIARDERYWRAQLEFCGEDRDKFLVACEGGRTIGYIRAGFKKGSCRILEFGAEDNRTDLFGTLLSTIMTGMPGVPVTMILSRKGKERLEPLPPHRTAIDTDAMVLRLDAGFASGPGAKLAVPGEFMFWLSDSF